MSATRVSSRANKGQPPKRDLEISLEQERIEKESKKVKIDVSHKTDSDDVTTSDESIVKCVPCGTTQDNYNEETDTGGTFIQCDTCNTWQHARCMGYKTAKAIPVNYECSECLSKQNEVKAVPETPKETPKETKKEVKAPKVLLGVELLRNKIQDETRLSTAKAFYIYFKKLIPETYTEESKEQLSSKWSLHIERLIFTNNGAKKYIEEGRRILFLLKKHFMGDILDDKLTFEELISKTPGEINTEIEQVERKVRSNIKNIILTRNEPQDIIRRTHKGDIIRETDNVDEYHNMVGIAKKVDHRRFGEPTPVTVNNTVSLNSYQNFNPRIEDEGDDEEEEEEEAGREDSGSDSSLKEYEVEEAPEVQVEQAEQNEPKQDIRNKIWSGKITFPQFASFNATAQFYNSSDDAPTTHKLDICADIFLYSSYFVEGKFDRQRADNYLDKLLGSRHIYLIELKSNDTVEFDKMLQYLSQKNRVGVLLGKPWFVKDSYLLAIDFAKEVPDYLRLLKVSRQEESLGMYALFTVKKDYEPKHELEVGLAQVTPEELARTSNSGNGTDLTEIMKQLRDSQAAR